MAKRKRTSKRSSPPRPPIKGKPEAARRQRFAKLVAAGRSGTDAVIESTTRPIGRAGAAVTAARWGQRPDVQAAVAEAQQAALDYLQVEVNVYYEQLHAIATFDPATCYDDKGRLLALSKMPATTRMAIQGMDVVLTNLTAGDGHIDQVAKIKVVNKMDALALIFKARGWIVQRKETGKHGDFEKLDEAQTLRRLEELAPKVGLRLVKTGTT